MSNKDSNNNAKKILYTSRDYVSIFDDLVASIPDVSQKWVSRDESDPGIVLIKLMSMLGDMLSFNQDKMALEVYPDSVTQRKNAAQIFQLLGYKMKWYRSATCDVNIVNTYSQGAKMPRYSVVKTKDESISYTNIKDVELPSNTNNNGKEVIVNMVQGVPILPPKKTGAILPGPNEEWHEIYSPNVDPNDIIDCRLYLNDREIDQDNIVLIDNFNEEWIKVDNVNLQTSTGKFFELRIDEFDRPYLYLINYWKRFDVTSFRLFYIKTLGAAGQVADNVLSVLDSHVYSTSGPIDNQDIFNVSSYIQLSNSASTYGYDPETPDEARKEASYYVNTLDTLITLDDFRKATMRLRGVANCKATDCTNDPGTVTEYMYGDVNKDGVIDILDRQELIEYVENPEESELTAEQLKLADLNGDGKVDNTDIEMITRFINGDVEDTGRIGQLYTRPLDSYIVRIYIVRTPEAEGEDPALFKNGILSILDKYKMMPLQIEIDLDSINNYYWTVKGSLYLRSPIDLDKAQDLLVAINNKLKFDYAVDKVDFNTTVRYIDVVNSIMSLDNSIQYVDLEPIQYEDEMGNVINPELISGKAREVIPCNPKDTTETGKDLVYDFTLSNVPVKPGSIIIKAESGAYTFRDNNNGKITNTQGRLVEPGTIDYATGKVHFELVEPFNQEFTIDYNKNMMSLARYMNLNSITFNIAPESLKS